jgi:hypothetical protein
MAISSVKDTRLTYFIILTGASFIGILHLLPAATQSAIAQLLRLPLVMAAGLLFILWLAYQNILGAIIVLAMFVCAFMPFSNEQYSEGFTSDQGLNSNNKVIKDLLKPGPLRRELEKARATNKEMFEAEQANNKFMEYEERKKAKSAAKQATNSKKKEHFGNTTASREIQQRRFNPGSQADVHLLQSMEIFDDIKDRIKYDYEGPKYLKRYIRERLEEVVDMLDLVSDEPVK